MLAVESPQHVDHARRFGALGRLYGQGALARFVAARVCVIGVGGVGSWVAEALARSAIGELTLIDLDHVAESNINRQIHACDATLGQAKVIAMAERIAGINPACVVHQVEEFIDPGNVADYIGRGKFDYVVDAMDDVKAKVALIAYCQATGVRLVTVGAAGGQRDASRVRVTDLARTEHEPLLAKVRKRLRTEHGFARNIKTLFGIAAVFSDEPLSYPQAVCDPDQPDPSGITGLNCAGFGSVVAVTGVFGLIAAGHVLQALAADVASAPGP